MELTRREAIVGLAALGTIAGCSRVADGTRRLNAAPMSAPTMHDDTAVAILDRFGFGPSRQSVADIKELGNKKWFEKQLEATDDEPADLGLMLGRLEINYLGPYDLRSWKEEAIIAQMQQATVLRAVYSPWQVRERVIDFWTNHFNIYARKGLGAYRKPMDERFVVRAHALGSFPAMVQSSAKSAAMLVFLDQQNSNAAHPNENYARELMELHTLGVDGGYTQKDVMEVARCFTGWTEERGFLKKKGAFLFEPKLHDKGEKHVLGHKIPAGQGVEDGEQVVRIVSRHPSTFAYLGKKLAKYYVGLDAPQSERRITEAFGDSDGDIKTALRTAFDEFLAHGQPVVKRPFDFAVSALRALDASTDAGLPVLDMLARMGQPLYLWPMPDGYPVEPDAWSGSLLQRWNFASQLTRGDIKGTRLDLEKLSRDLGGDKASQVVFHRMSRPTFDAEHKDLTLADKVSLCLCSPEFQWR